MYSSQYFWDSAEDLDGIDDTVEVMAVPTDGWQDGISDMISFHVDNNDVPEITFEPMSGEYSGNIILPFTLFNPESEDEITYEFQYFYNQWNIIQDSSISINNNYFSWNSRHYLDSLDIDNVQVLAFPLDNDVGLPDTTSSFSIDNVHSHTAVFNPTDTGLENDQYSGIVPFSIVVNDSSEDNLSVLCYYKIPNETEWIYFHEFEDINPPYSDSYGYAWSTLDMINLQEIDENIYVKIIPSDGFEPGIPDSALIHLDNNNVPSVSFNNNEISNENNGDVEISFLIDNDEGDADSVWFEFRYKPDVDSDDWTSIDLDDISLGDNLRSSVISSYSESMNSPSSLSSNRQAFLFDFSRFRDITEASLTWHSNNNIPDLDLQSVIFSIRPSDEILSNEINESHYDQGNWTNSEPFHIDNFQQHSIQITSDFMESGDTIIFNYEISDYTNDTIDMVFEYSINSVDWLPMSTEESIENTLSYVDSIAWFSQDDLNGYEDNVLVRIKISDGFDSYDSLDVFNFLLDNNEPPLVSQFAVPLEQSETHDIVLIEFEVEDNENDDMIDISLNVQTPDNNWISILDTLVNSPSYNNNNTFQFSYDWPSFIDFPDQELDVNIEITTSDGSGLDDQNIINWPYSFLLDNNQNQTAELYFSNTDEYSGDTEVSFTIFDDTADSLSMVLYYEDYETGSWEILSIVDNQSIINLSPEEYASSTFTWITTADLPNADVITSVKSIVSDEWGPGPEVIVENIHIDNENGPQLISQDPIKIYPHPENSVILAFNMAIDPQSVDDDAIRLPGLGDIQLSMISDSLIKVSRPSGYPTNSQFTIEITPELQDPLGKSFDGNSDGDPGPDDELTMVIETELLGDFDSSGVIDINDLQRFQNGWLTNENFYEMGPVEELNTSASDTGNFIFQPDGKFDIEDLMTFIRMWNYCDDYGQCLGEVLLLTSETENNGSLISSYDNNRLALGFDTNEKPNAIELSIEYNNEMILLGDAYSDTTMDPHKNAIILDKNTSNPNLRSNVIGFFENINNESNWFINFPLDLIGEESEIITIHYSYTSNGENILGRKEITIAPIPDQFLLYQNYPNPFNPITTIKYALPKESYVDISVYDILGHKIKSLVKEQQTPGIKNVEWDTSNELGRKVSSGVYFYIINADDFRDIKKMLIVK